MTLLAWNCRGLGAPFAVRALKNVVNAVVGLLETKIDARRCELVRIQLGFDCCFCVPARGKSGGLALLWKNEPDVCIINFSFYHIDFTVNLLGRFRGTLFYGHPRASLRYMSWDLLRRLKGFNNLPWCIFGDFNEISRFSESTSMNRNRGVQIEQFQKVLSDCELVDLGFRGPHYTYSNKRQGGHEVKCRLDRVLADTQWMSKYHNHDSAVLHLSSHHSDHRPIFLNLCKKEIIREKNFGNVNVHLRNLKQELEQVHQQPRCSESVDKENFLVNEIDEWLAREELMWAQRSRVSWLREGDNNTRFFHLKANARSKLNKIVELMDDGGMIKI